MIFYSMGSGLESRDRFEYSSALGKPLPATPLRDELILLLENRAQLATNTGNQARLKRRRQTPAQTLSRGVQIQN